MLQLRLSLVTQREKKNSGDGSRGREGKREGGKEKAATSSPAYKTRKGSSQQEENKDPNKEEKSNRTENGPYGILHGTRSGSSQEN